MFGGGGGEKATKIKEGGEKGRWERGSGGGFEILVEARVFTGFLKPGYSIIHLMLRAAARQYGNRAVPPHCDIKRRREEVFCQHEMPHFVFKASEKDPRRIGGGRWGVEGVGNHVDQAR